MFETAAVNKANRVRLSVEMLDVRWKANNHTIPFLFRCQGSLPWTLRKGMLGARLVLPLLPGDCPPGGKVGKAPWEEPSEDRSGLGSL